MNIFLRTTVAASTELLSWSTGTTMSGTYRDPEVPELDVRWARSWSQSSPRTFSWRSAQSMTNAHLALWQQAQQQERLIGIPRSPSGTATKAPADDQAAKRKRIATATEEIIHKFERTDAAVQVNRDQFRAIIYAILQKIPPNRQEEAMEDMYMIASIRNGGTALKYLVDQTGDVEKDDQRMFTVDGNYFDNSILSNGTKDNYRTVWFAYTDTNRECKQRGTNIIDEAKAKIGE